MKKKEPKQIVGNVYVDLSTIDVLTTINEYAKGVHVIFKGGYDEDIAKLIKSVQRTGDTITIIGVNYVFKGAGRIESSLMKPNTRYGEQPNMSITVLCTEYTLTYGPSAVRSFKIDSLTN